jgi:hypothetical protein
MLICEKIREVNAIPGIRNEGLKLAFDKHYHKLAHDAFSNDKGKSSVNLDDIKNVTRKILNDNDIGAVVLITRRCVPLFSILSMLCNGTGDIGVSTESEKLLIKDISVYNNIDALKSYCYEGKKILILDDNIISGQNAKAVSESLLAMDIPLENILLYSYAIRVDMFPYELDAFPCFSEEGSEVFFYLDKDRRVEFYSTGESIDNIKKSGESIDDIKKSVKSIDDITRSQAGLSSFSRAIGRMIRIINTPAICYDPFIWLSEDTYDHDLQMVYDKLNTETPDNVEFVGVEPFDICNDFGINEGAFPEDKIKIRNFRWKYPSRNGNPNFESLDRVIRFANIMVTARFNNNEIKSLSINPLFIVNNLRLCDIINLHNILLNTDIPNESLKNRISIREKRKVTAKAITMETYFAMEVLLLKHFCNFFCIDFEPEFITGWEVFGNETKQSEIQDILKYKDIYEALDNFHYYLYNPNEDLIVHNQAFKKIVEEIKLKEYNNKSEKVKIALCLSNFLDGYRMFEGNPDNFKNTPNEGRCLSLKNVVRFIREKFEVDDITDIYTHLIYLARNCLGVCSVYYDDENEIIYFGLRKGEEVYKASINCCFPDTIDENGREKNFYYTDSIARLRGELRHAYFVKCNFDEKSIDSCDRAVESFLEKYKNHIIKYNDKQYRPFEGSNNLATKNYIRGDIPVNIQYETVDRNDLQVTISENEQLYNETETLIDEFYDILNEAIEQIQV